MDSIKKEQFQQQQQKHWKACVSIPVIIRLATILHADWPQNERSLTHVQSKLNHGISSIGITSLPKTFFFLYVTKEVIAMSVCQIGSTHFEFTNI